MKNTDSLEDVAMSGIDFSNIYGGSDADTKHFKILREAKKEKEDLWKFLNQK